MSGLSGFGKPSGDQQGAGAADAAQDAAKNPNTQGADSEKIIDGATGESRDKMANHDELDALLASQQPKPVELTEYSCHPIQILHMGRFHFENGMLRLKPEDVEEFETLLAQQPIRHQNQIHKLADEKARADAMAKQFMQTRRTRGVDTSTTGSAEKPIS